MNKLSDFHMHSNCSFDARNSVNEMCERAIELNLKSISFTDHFECRMYAENDLSFGNYDENIKRSFIEVNNAKNIYKDRLEVSFGVEIGEPCAYPEITDRFIIDYNFDFVMASIHNVGGPYDFYLLDYNDENIPVYLKIYYDELLKTAKYGNFDCIGHFTYPYRYIMGRDGFSFNEDIFKNEIDEILKTVISRGKSIEINTSTLRQGMNETMPHKNIIKRYKELGGKYLTLGSDAHNTEDLGKGLFEARRIALDCGFESYTIYKNRKPILVNF